LNFSFSELNFSSLSLFNTHAASDHTQLLTGKTLISDMGAEKHEPDHILFLTVADAAVTKT
jgi:hypothetical protein